MSKLIVSDIDGTLVTSKNELTAETVSAIEKARNKGHMFVLASGRNRVYVINMAKRASASGIVIAANGSDVYDCDTDTEIYRSRIKFSTLKKVFELTNAAGCEVLYEAGFNNYCNTPIVRESPTTLIKSLEMLENVAKNEGITQMVITAYDENTIKYVKQEVIKLGLGIGNQSKTLTDARLTNYESDYFYIDVLNRKCNKCVGIKKLAKALRIKKENIVAIGDDKNDLDMFNFCGHKVAVENAIDVLKQNANEVVPSNNQNGVAQFLTKHFDLNN